MPKRRSKVKDRNRRWSCMNRRQGKRTSGVTMRVAKRRERVIWLLTAKYKVIRSSWEFRTITKHHRIIPDNQRHNGFMNHHQSFIIQINVYYPSVRFTMQIKGLCKVTIYSKKSCTYTHGHVGSLCRSRIAIMGAAVHARSFKSYIIAWGLSKESHRQSLLGKYRKLKRCIAGLCRFARHCKRAINTTQLCNHYPVDIILSLANVIWRLILDFDKHTSGMTSQDL